MGGEGGVVGSCGSRYAVGRGCFKQKTAYEIVHRDWSSDVRRPPRSTQTLTLFPYTTPSDLIHAEGYASGELKHGPIALIDRDVPVIVLAPHDALFEKTVSNMQEVMARHGPILLLSDEAGLSSASHGVQATLRMPSGGGVFQPILYAIPMQYLAYHTAVAKGTDVDQPRNLAKSVTVE